VRKLAGLWADIKKLRAEQEFACTTVRLKLHKHAPDREADMAQLEQDLGLDLEMARARHHAHAAHRLAEYRDALQAWEQRRAAHAQAAELHNIDPAHARDPGPWDDAARPTIPALPEFDEAAERNQLVEGYKKTKRAPGQAILAATLTETHSPTPAPSANIDEQVTAHMSNPVKQVYL
jgi:hypothetical protein